MEDRGRGDRDEFTVYYTRLDSVQEHFFFHLNVRIKVLFLILIPPLPSDFTKIDGDVVNSGRNQVAQTR